MSLKTRILDYVQAAKRRPAIGSDPKELARLERAALEDWGGSFGATHAPIAPYNWEVSVVLAGTPQQSVRQPLRIPNPVLIVGMNPVIEVLATGGATVPTLTSIDVSIDRNTNDVRTSAQGAQTTTAGQVDGTFISLASIGVASTSGNRLWGWRLEGTTTDIGFTFRWKQAAGTYKDTIVRVTVFARDLDA